MKNQREVLMTNLLIKEDTCNANCAYCYRQDAIKFTEPYLYAGSLKEKIDKMISFANEKFDSPLIRISGGEIFLMSNLREFVEKLLKNHKYVLIQTNGLRIDKENLKWIIELKRVFIQVSLDGHTLEMNEYRFNKPEVLKNFLHLIEVLKENDVYLELVSVLNNRNMKGFSDFIEYVDGIPGGRNENALKVTPLLIMDKESFFKPSKNDLKSLDQMIQNYERFSHILPPKIYLENLNKLLHGEKIKYQCFNPIATLNMTDDGKIKSCTNVLPERFLNVGDLTKDSPEEVAEKYGKTKFQKLLLTTKQWFPVCRTCLDFASIYNLYFNDTISLEELSENNYLYGLPELREQLKKVKARICLETMET